MPNTEHCMKIFFKLCVSTNSMDCLPSGKVAEHRGFTAAAAALEFCLQR